MSQMTRKCCICQRKEGMQSCTVQQDECTYKEYFGKLHMAMLPGPMPEPLHGPKPRAEGEGPYPVCYECVVFHGLESSLSDEDKKLLQKWAADDEMALVLRSARQMNDEIGRRHPGMYFIRQSLELNKQTGEVEPMLKLHPQVRVVPRKNGDVEILVGDGSDSPQGNGTDSAERIKLS